MIINYRYYRINPIFRYRLRALLSSGLQSPSSRQLRWTGTSTGRGSWDITSVLSSAGSTRWFIIYLTPHNYFNWVRLHITYFQGGIKPEYCSKFFNQMWEHLWWNQILTRIQLNIIDIVLAIGNAERLKYIDASSTTSQNVVLYQLKSRIDWFFPYFGSKSRHHKSDIILKYQTPKISQKVT